MWRRGIRSSWGRLFAEAPAVLTLVCLEAICRAFPIPSGPSAPQGLFLGYNDLQEGCEEVWNTGAWGQQRNLGLFSGMVRGVGGPGGLHRSLSLSIGPYTARSNRRPNTREPLTPIN